MTKHLHITYRGHYDMTHSIFPSRLGRILVFRSHLCVIMLGFQAVLLSQLLGNLLAAVSGLSVDDAGLVGVPAFDERCDLMEDLLRFEADIVVKIRTIKGFLEHNRLMHLETM